MTKLTDIAVSDTVHFTLRRPAFVTHERVYRPSRKPQQNRGYHSVNRGLGRVLSHDVDNELLIVQFANSYDLGPNRPEFPVEIPWWNLRKLLRWTGEYNDPTSQVSRGKEIGSTVLNRLRQAYMRQLDPIEWEQPQSMPPSMLFEEVQIWLPRS